MIDVAHSESLLRPGGLDAIREWSHRSTERQRSALSSLLLSLSDFNEFKALMLAHKTERDGRGGALDGLLCGRGLESATR